MWAQLFRSRTRTLLTLLSVVAAFLLFGMLDSVRVAFSSGGSVEGANRLIVASRLSITQSLPIRPKPRSARWPACATWPTACGSAASTGPEELLPELLGVPNYFDVYRELQIDPAQLEDWKQTRTGAIVGETLAKQFGWKIGDTIPLQATIFPRGGSNDWPLVLKGIYRSKDRALAANEERQLMMNWKYFDESNDYIKNR